MVFTALHAAIIAINATLDADVVKDTLEALLNPAACLEGICADNSEQYYLVLKVHKQQKVL